jgi:release factor glutamine methyltransferase
MRHARRGLCAAASLALAHGTSFRLPPSATLGVALQHATAALASADVPAAGPSAEHLLAAAAGFGSDRSALALQRGATLSAGSREAFERMTARRLAREPVQYILGEWDFRELTLALRPPVLIPRPETEELVGHVLQAHGGGGCAPLRLLDVGCGSGAIGLALLHALPRATCEAIDVCDVATALASENAERCGVDARYRASLVPGGVRAYAPAAADFDVVVSNPPYIPADDMAALEAEVAAHEDERALCGGVDGLDVVRDVLAACPALLRPSGPCAVWLEVDTSHPPLIDEWLRQPAQAALRLQVVRARDDLYGRPRFVELRYDPS